MAINVIEITAAISRKKLLKKLEAMLDMMTKNE